jgi:hypothetical protein
MLLLLIALSLMLLFGWAVLAWAWRRSRMVKRIPHRYSGAFVNIRPGAPLVMLSGTLCTAAGWIIFLVGANGGRAFWPVGFLVLALLAGGFGCFAWLVVAFGSSRAAFGPIVSFSPNSSGSGDGESSAMYIADATLRAGERLVGKYPTNHVQGGLGRGGHLLLTSERLVFAPASGSAARGAKHWQVDLQGIFTADVAPRGSNLLDGSLRHRLRLTDTSGHTDYFLVWHPGKVAGAVNSLRRASRRSSDNLRVAGRA